MKNGPYTLVIAPAEYPGKKYRGRYVYEHHLIWWRNHGFVVPEDYQIHHKNKDCRDNRIENLEMIYKCTHSALHKQGKGATVTLLNCGFCLKPFAKETRNFKVKSNQGQKIFCCSRECFYNRLRKNIAS